MISTLWLSLALLTAQPDDRAAYETAKAQAGRDADAHVKLALWCEHHGMTAERLKHLATAVLLDPKNATARGLMGLVAYQGRWQRPDQVRADERLAAALADYNGRRTRMAHTADAHWKLALWCEENGLTAEAAAHLTAVTRLDPGREAAWKRLGYKKHNGRWLTEAQVAAEKDELEAQKKADKHWKPLLAKWREWLADENKRAEAETLLENITDPRAVPLIWTVFALGDERAQTTAVQLLGQIDGPGSSRGLAALAIVGRSAHVRRVATEMLRRRDLREFVGPLIGTLLTPVKYKVNPGAAPGQAPEVVVETALYNVRRVYSVDPQRVISQDGLIPISVYLWPIRFFGASVPFDPFGPQNLWLASQPLYVGTATPASHALHTGQPSAAPGSHGLHTGQPSATGASGPNMMVVAARRDILLGIALRSFQMAAIAGRQRLANDVATLDALNADIHESNSQVLPVLTTVTGQDLGDSQEAWQEWWSDQRGLVYDVPSSDEKPTFTEFVPNPVPLPIHSCFGAGTPVRTWDGWRPIESIRVGDRILTQDTRTGQLRFEPAVAVYHNKPAATLEITLGDESVTATGIHRFWKAGHGWVMARNLNTGDSVRTVGGMATVTAVEEAPVQPVFNLEVASGQSFFVGKQGVLVHDNSLVQPVHEPFDAPPSLAPLTTAGH